MNEAIKALGLAPVRWSAWLGGIKWHLWNLTHKPALYLVYLRLQVRYPFLKLLKCGVKCVYGSRNVACKALITLLEFRNFFFYRFFFHIDPRGVFMPPNMWIYRSGWNWSSVYSLVVA